MRYIVVDFEWNQGYSECRYGRKKMPFEIIEIGAVMLDEELREIDRFSETIKPKVHKKLHHVTRDLTGITEKELEQSDTFPHVLVDFMLWCGEEFIFCTWGNSDLVELQRNMKYYRLDDLLIGPIKYYNVQRFYREFFPDGFGGVSLEAAIDYLGLPKNDEFHRAVNDAAYTADILRRIDLREADKHFSLDYYQNPQSKHEEIHLTYDDHYKYVSREFDTREKALADREVRSTHCYICGRNLHKTLPWFATRTKLFYCLTNSPEHGNIRGKIRVKKTDEENLYVVKTIRAVDNDEADHIRQMKEDVIEKRRERRHREKEQTEDFDEDILIPDDDLT